MSKGVGSEAFGGVCVRVCMYFSIYLQKIKDL